MEEKRKNPRGRRQEDGLMKVAIESIAHLVSTVEWLAQTVHQARHQQCAKTWKECSLGVCRGAREGLKKARITQ